MGQKFEGDIHGGQFGIIHNPPPEKEEQIPDNHPWKVVCPQCAHTTLRFNEYCGNGKCTFGIKAFFDEQEQIVQEQEREKQKGFRSLIGFAGLIVSAIIGYIGSQWFDSPKMALWYLGEFVWLFIWLKSAEQQ